AGRSGRRRDAPLKVGQHRRVPMSAAAIHTPPKVESSENVRVITFTCEEARDGGEMIARQLGGHADGLGAAHLLLDFTNVTSLGDAALGTLVTLHQRVRAAGGR